MSENHKHRDNLIKKVKEDFQSASDLSKIDNFSEEIILFHYRQAIEKALKAYLDFKKILYPKTHDLETLLNMCLEINPSFNKIAFITSLTPYAVEIRYDEFIDASTNEVDHVLKQTREALDIILGEIE